MEAYIGSVWAFGCNFAPLGWSFCNGALISISSNEALFALLGTTFGGDGVSTFALPNLQGRVPIGTGQGPGLSNFVLGQSGGSESVTLTASNMPIHTHPIVSVNMHVSGRGGETDPANNYFGGSDSDTGETYNSTSNVLMAGPSTGTSGATGSSIPMGILSPFQVVNYCICMEGVFPSRS